jgi:hypothetical protein
LDHSETLPLEKEYPMKFFYSHRGIVKVHRMSHREFKGDQKVGESVFMRWENNFRNHWVPKLPSWIETWHLTYLTLIWSGLILVFSWNAKENLQWLWLVSLMILAQYVSDLFDGALGRYRKTGLIKWGYYMDHLLDYVFQSCIVVGYMMIAPEGLTWYFVGILIVSGAYMVNAFLSFAATNNVRNLFFRDRPNGDQVLNYYAQYFHHFHGNRLVAHNGSHLFLRHSCRFYRPCLPNP